MIAFNLHRNIIHSSCFKFHLCRSLTYHDTAFSQQILSIHLQSCTLAATTVRLLSASFLPLFPPKIQTSIFFCTQLRSLWPLRAQHGTTEIQCNPVSCWCVELHRHAVQLITAFLQDPPCRPDTRNIPPCTQRTTAEIWTVLWCSCKLLILMNMTLPVLVTCGSNLLCVPTS